MMMMMSMIIGEIASKISCSGFPKYGEKALSKYILYPIKSHSHGLCTLFLHLVFDDAIHKGVVHLNGGCH